LFLIYVNDIPNSVPNQKVRIFADDTNLFVTGDTITSAIDVANNEFNHLNNWLLANKLSLSIDKTCYMTFPPDKTNTKLYINGIEIKKVTHCRYLGVTIDDKLNWMEHIQYIYNKLIRYTSIFYKLKNKLPETVLTSIYYAFVHSHLLYAIEIYANTCQAHLEKLVKLNNKILRILQNRPIRFPVLKLYSDYSTLPLTELHKQQLLLLVHKYIYHPEKLPEAFENYFELNRTIHSHDTRTANSVHIFQVNSTRGQRCVKYKSATLWNSLPASMKETGCTQLFKAQLKSYLLQ
jgi:hypothetical protein